MRLIFPLDTIRERGPIKLTPGATTFGPTAKS